MAEDKLVPCPMCREMIIAGARKCRFCNERLDGGVAGAARGKVRWVGNKVIVSTTAKVPPSPCWVCAGDDGTVVKRQKNFSYVNPIAYLSYLGGILVGVIVVAILRERRTLAIPLCEPCATRWMWVTVGYVAFAILGLFGLPTAFGFIGNEIARDGGVFLGVVLGILTWIIGLIVIVFVVMPKYQAVCDNIDGQQVFLKLPNIEAVRAARQRDKSEEKEEAEGGED